WRSHACLEGPMATVRNPLAGFAITIFGALALAFLAGIPILFLPQAELVYFYLPFALFGVGMLSGRSGFLGTLGFVGGTLGGFVGIYVFQTLRSEEHTSELQSPDHLV